jgi:hypothetical protein
MRALSLVAACILLSSLPSYADRVVDVERLATAIYWAEGGAKTKHPYGILAKYKHTTPRQACINTINSNHKRWTAAGCPGDFIEYLGLKYCPPSAHPLNRNWVRNVRRLYEKQKET